MTENTAKWSQGGKWKPLNPEYAEAKKKKYAKYPGGGKRMMIATGRLLAAMLVQDGQDSVKIVRNKSLIIAVKPKEDFGYWKWADKKRTVTKFKVGFYRMLAKEYVKFIRGAK